jgi:hypothetical protein
MYGTLRQLAAVEIPYAVVAFERFHMLPRFVPWGIVRVNNTSIPVASMSVIRHRADSGLSGW